MQEETLSALDELFREFPILASEPASEGDIALAQDRIGLPLPDEYAQFLLKYGGAMVGAYPVYGFKPVDPMGNMWSVIDVNQRFREDGWEGLGDWVIVSMDHGGNPIGITPDGKVHAKDHDFGGSSFIAESFEVFLRRECLEIE